MSDHEYSPQVQAQHADDLKALGRRINTFLNPLKDLGGPMTTGFCLLIFDLGKTGRMNYLSNTERSDMLKALKEFTAHVEAHVAEEAQT